MPRDPKASAIQAVLKAQATREKCDAMAAQAVAAYRESIIRAVAAGCSRSQVAKALGTSDSRVRQLIQRGHQDRVS